MAAALTQQAAGQNCVVPADPDLLGLGVRLGFYLQFTSNVLLLKRCPEEAVGSIVLSSMFMSGFFVALLYSITHNSLPPGAIIPTANFLFLDVSMAIPISFIADTSNRSGISFWTIVVFVLRWSAFNGFLVWFWYRGINSHNPNQCKEPRILVNLAMFHNQPRSWINLQISTSTSP